MSLAKKDKGRCRGCAALFLPPPPPSPSFPSSSSSNLDSLTSSSLDSSYEDIGLVDTANREVITSHGRPPNVTHLYITGIISSTLHFIFLKLSKALTTSGALSNLSTQREKSAISFVLSAYLQTLRESMASPQVRIRSSVSAPTKEVEDAMALPRICILARTSSCMLSTALLPPLVSTSTASTRTSLPSLRTLPISTAEGKTVLPR
mmetsp:Transcript_11050/g.22024  ORF Transcript_11050/g.22024 Transcript_11050/m.22024 type:complete len:206 (+) Transcript_11050:1115-1732(+)